LGLLLSIPTRPTSTLTACLRSTSSEAFFCVLNIVNGRAQGCRCLVRGGRTNFHSSQRSLQGS
jgi:hypothetical protein